MILTKSQVALLSKWAKGGRLVVRPLMPAESVPEWAKHEFRLTRAVIDAMRDGMKWRDAQTEKKAKQDVSRETLSSVLAKIEAKTREKPASYSKGACKGWETRKRQARARAAQAETNQTGEAKAA